MTRSEFYGINAEAEFTNAMNFYCKHPGWCNEKCNQCGEGIDCKTAWMQTVVNGEGEVRQ